MAVSMYQLQVFFFGVLVVMIHMVHFQNIFHVQVQSALGTFPVLPFEKFCYSWTYEGVFTHARGPICPVPIVGTRPPFHFDVFHSFVVTVEHEEFSFVGFEAPLESPVLSEIFPLYPLLAFVIVTEFCPSPELSVRLMVRFLECLSGHTCSVVLAPSSNYWIEFVNYR